jgi:hypothetical protein
MSQCDVVLAGADCAGYPSGTSPTGPQDAEFRRSLIAAARSLIPSELWCCGLCIQVVNIDMLNTRQIVVHSLFNSIAMKNLVW